MQLEQSAMIASVFDASTHYVKLMQKNKMQQILLLRKAKNAHWLKKLLLAFGQSTAACKWLQRQPSARGVDDFRRKP